MRILLAQNSRYYPAHGGGDKSNRLLKAEDAMVTYHSAAPLLPGETRVQRSTAQLAVGYDHYDITVLEVD